MEWIALEQFDFDNENLVEIHVDTRDFHVFGRTETKEKVVEYPTRVVAIEKIKTTLIRFKASSGGEKEWRHFDICDTKYSNCWDFKYLRFKKSSAGWLFVREDKHDKSSIDSAYPADYLDKEGVDWVTHYYKNNPIDKKEAVQEFQTYENSLHKSTDSYIVYENNNYISRVEKPSQYVRKTPKIQNNEPCICGSGKKFKKCCK